MLGAMEDSQPTRRWYRFSLRKLLVLVALCAIPSSWLAVKLRDENRQEGAAATIQEVGGIAEWDENAIVPAWLNEVLGEHFCRYVVRVTLQGERATDRTLKSLGTLDHLEELTLLSTNVTDVGFQHLQVLHRLKELHIEDANVTDLGLEKIAEMKQIETLRLYGTHISDSGLEKLAGMSRLRSLGLDGTNVTDASLERLQRMKQLTSVLLIDTQATAAGVKRLQQALPNCTISCFP
jgi:hypothetical protein